MDSFITVVSGLPRSGTSMMMKMLAAGGMTPLTDRQRLADEDNPQGYYEFERVKRLPQGDTAWLADAQGKAVKIIAALLPSLPSDYEYRILIMQRDMGEILRSQKKMLEHRGAGQTVSDEQLSRLFEKNLQQVDAWIRNQPRILRLDVNYNGLLRNPIPDIARIRLFLDFEPDADKMIGVIDPGLYRQRAYGKAIR